jgi:hypothetical protein
MQATPPIPAHSTQTPIPNKINPIISIFVETGRYPGNTFIAFAILLEPGLRLAYTFIAFANLITANSLIYAQLQRDPAVF